MDDVAKNPKENRIVPNMALRAEMGAAAFRVRCIRPLSSSPSAVADQIRSAPSTSPGSAFAGPVGAPIEIDVVGLEPPQARFAGLHEMQARCSDIVWAVVREVREPAAITIVAPPRPAQKAQQDARASRKSR